MAKTVNKHIRIEAEVWDRLEAAARDHNTTANRLLTQLATQWLKDREWPLTDVQIQVARASLFTAQAIVHDMTTAGRDKEFTKIRRYISTIVPDLSADSRAVNEPSVETTVPVSEVRDS